jgi:trehalose synthase
MSDPDENARIVNAIQRHASVVLQKSLAEGFGLTVAEAMWKSRAVVATAVGGIQDQIQDGTDGLLVKEPDDLRAFGDAVARLLADPALADRLGTAAHETVRSRFLGDRHPAQYGALLDSVLG